MPDRLIFHVYARKVHLSAQTIVMSTVGPPMRQRRRSRWWIAISMA